MAEPGQRATRRALGDVRGVGGVDHVGRVLLVGHPQGDPQVGVGLDLGRHHAGRALGGEDQVYAERPAPAGDVDQAVDEVRQLLHHRGELVDHQQQTRHRFVVGGLGRQVVVDVLRVGVCQLVLAATKFGAERFQRASGQVAVEVGHHADRVRQQLAVLEGRTTLVVHQDEGELVRTVADGKRRDDGLEQLRLTGTGGTGDQAVRPVRLDVQAEDALDTLTHDGPGGPAATTPALHDVFPGRVVQTQYVEQPRRVRQRRGGTVGRGVAHRGERSGQPLTPLRRDEVGLDALDRRLLRGREADLRGSTGDQRAALLRELALVFVETDQEDPVPRSLTQQGDDARVGPELAGAVEYDDDLVRCLGLLLLELLAVVEFGQQFVHPSPGGFRVGRDTRPARCRGRGAAGAATRVPRPRRPDVRGT